MMASSSATTHTFSTTLVNTHYIHAFGYALAQKLLGAAPVDDCIRQAYRLQQQDPVQKLHCFRANWRSGVRFPWQLPKSGVSGEIGREDEEEITPETLLVDITFDFILFPAEIVSEGRTHCCHVVTKEDFWGEDADNEREGNCTTEACDSIAIAVAIRIGALVAIPSSRRGDSSDGVEKAGDNDGGGGDEYHYYYQRGNNALTASDLDEHCRGIDIVLEEMDAADVARIMGDALLEDCHAGGEKPWQVVRKSENVSATLIGTSSDLTTLENLVTAEQRKKHLSWMPLRLKVRHQALEADGFLPLSHNGNIMGESIGRCMLDMILLQSNASRDGGVCVSVPKNEALMLWKEIDPTLVRAVEKPVEPPPQKISPVRKDIATRNHFTQKASPKEEKDVKAEKISRPNTATRRRPPRLQGTALFAKGKKTTLGGSRRKKPKFTLGPA